jgi:PhnB protein
MSKHIPPQGYNTVCPYIGVEPVDKELSFLESVFDATIHDDMKNSDGSTMHGEATIGDSVVMVGQVRENNPRRNAMLYVHVTGVADVYSKAIELGATSIAKPMDQFYGHRTAAFQDEFGIDWWIAEQTEELTREEMQKRLENQQ